jgi:hypothetical protein
MDRLQQRKLTRQEPDCNPNACLLCNARTGSLLTYQAIQARLRGMDIWESDIVDRDIGDRDIVDRDIGDRDIGDRDISERNIWERDIWERDIGETVATCRFAK